MSSKEKIVIKEVDSKVAAPSIPTTTPAPLGPQAQASAQELPVTFDRWFKVRGKERGFKPHWMAGMQAYTNVNVPRPMTEWDYLFRNY